MFQSVREKFLSRIKNTVLWTYGLSDLKGEEIFGKFYQKESQKTNQKEFRVEKVINRKGDKLYVKWKDDDISFNTWIDKKDIIQMSDYFPEPKYSRGNIQEEEWKLNEIYLIMQQKQI